MTSKTTAATLALLACALTACGPALVAGTGAVVARSVGQERSTLDALTDAEIELSISNSLANHSGDLFWNTSVDVTEGRVVLKGSVPTREDKVTATKIAWETPGVKEVTDALTVGEDGGTRAYLADVGISNRIRYDLLRDIDIRSSNYNVETVDGVVHLTGIARSDRELERVIAKSRAVSGVTKVVSHVLTIDDPRRTQTVVNDKDGLPKPRRGGVWFEGQPGPAVSTKGVAG